ncbi:copper-binding protein [Bacteroidota bacterium]
MRALRRLNLALLLFLTIAYSGCSNREQASDDNMRSIPIETISITGVLMDSWCYSKLTDEERANGSLSVDSACAEQSRQKGYPLVVVVDEDEAWVLSENPRLLRDALTDSVRVTGDVRSEGILIPRNVMRKVESAWTVMIDQASAYQVAGVVTHLTSDRDMIIVRHDEIDGYMGAMTMPFMVQDTSLISGVAPGDSIRFSMFIADGEATLNAVHFIAVGA